MHKITMLLFSNDDDYEAMRKHLSILTEFTDFGSRHGSEWNFPQRLISLTKLAGTDVYRAAKEYYSLHEPTYSLTPELVKELLILPSIEAIVQHASTQGRSVVLDD